jgi:AcrR family transcriptional regulator
VDQAAALRWGDDAPEDSDAARARILNAAETCFARFGVLKTTVEDIAKLAKVSRATVYRYFDGGRDEIVLGVILRGTDRYLARVRSRIDRQPSLAEAIVEFVEVTTRAARRDPSLIRLFNMDESRATGGMLTGASVALFEKVSMFFVPLFARWPSQVRPGVELADAAEWILRTILSMLSVDGPRRRSAEGQRQFLTRYLAAAITRS